MSSNTVPESCGSRRSQRWVKELYLKAPHLELPVKLDRVTLYLPPAIGVKTLPAIAAAKPNEFFVNPGAESDELVAEARELGLDPILACSIVDIGVSPADMGE